MTIEHQQQEQQTPSGAASELSGGVGVFLPCPFCGKVETLEIITGAELMDDDQECWQHSFSFAVICNAANPGGRGGCGAMGGFSATEAGATDGWNMRTPNA